MSLRIAVLVSGEGSNLQALIDSVHAEGAAEIVGVASSKPEARGVERARSAGIETTGGHYPVLTAPAVAAAA